MKKILIVEDNPDLRDLFTIIARRLGHEVAIAITGEEAVERASAVKPDLILMDVGLPKINGVEATKQIKADPTIKDIPVVILSALPISSYGKNTIEAGAVKVLLKPISITDLQNVLIEYTSAGSKPMESSMDSVCANRFHKTTNILH